MCQKTWRKTLFNDPTEMARLYNHRVQYYKKAKYEIDSERGTPEEMAELIIETLGLEVAAN